MIRERAAFIPATNLAGRPAIGTYANRVRWVNPNEADNLATRQLLSGPMEMAISYTVGIDGSISDCKIERQTVAPGMTKPQDPCPQGTHIPARTDNGKLVPRRYRLTFKTEVVPDK